MAQSYLDALTQLEDGSFVCSDHYLLCCETCRVRFEYMNEGQELDDTDDTGDSSEDKSPKMAQSSSGDLPYIINSSGVLPFTVNSSVFRTLDNMRLSTPSAPYKIGRFYPPNSNDTPQTLFVLSYSHSSLSSGPRFLRRSNPQELLIYTDGCCLNNGQQFPKAGCAFVFRPASEVYPGGEYFRLELRGPLGDEYTQTSNRAELRAVIAALKFRVWQGEGFTRLIIATDSDYVVSGITSWVDSWARKGWLTSMGTPVKNRDLWEWLIKEVKDLARYEYMGTHGLEVLFWLIPRGLNTLADQLAKKAAASERDRVSYTEISGFMV